MENKNNDLDFDKIGLVTSDFVKVADQLKLACAKIVNNKFSKYPIIVMGSENFNVGSLFIDREELLVNKLVYYENVAASKLLFQKALRACLFHPVELL